MKKLRIAPPLWLCWFTGIGGLATYFLAKGDIVTSAVTCLIGLTSIIGYWLGKGAISVFLLAFVTSAFFAARVVEAFGPPVSSVLGTIGILNSLLAVCIGCVVLGAAAMVTYDLVWNRLMGKRGTLKPFDRGIAMVVGAMQGVAMSLVILGAIQVAEPYARFAANMHVASVRGYLGRCTADSVVKIGLASRRTPLRPFLQAYNPFERLPQLRRLHASPIYRFVEHTARPGATACARRPATGAHRV